MTTPTNRISEYKQSGEDRADFTKKDDLENLALVITNAKTAKGPKGLFWIVEATRQDTGEVVTFTGSKVIDDVMGQVKAHNAFPVAAMLVKIKADNPQGYYWDVQDPPASSNGNGAPTSNRIDEVGKLLERGVTVADVQAVCKDVSGHDAKVNDLSDEQYRAALARLNEIAANVPPAPEDEF